MDKLTARETEVTDQLAYAARYTGETVDALRADLDAALPETGTSIRALRRLILATERACAAQLASLRT